MYVQIRLRTLLIAIALLIPPLAYSTYHGWLAVYHGFLAFRNDHATQAIHDWREAHALRRQSVALLKSYGSPDQVRRAEELRERSDALLRKVYWHFLLSGDSGEDVVGLQQAIGWVEEPVVIGAE